MMSFFKRSFIVLLQIIGALAGALYLTSCQESVYANKDEASETEMTISDSASFINSSNKNTFDFNIKCPAVTKRIYVSGSISTVIECQKTAFTASLDLTSVPDGPVHLTFKPNIGRPVHFSYSKDVIPPNVSGLASDLVPAQNKNWNWACVDTSPNCTYRFVVNKSPIYIFTAEAFSATNSYSKLFGNGIYYLHVQARDPAGNISSTQTVSAELSNPTPSAIYIVSPGKTETLKDTVDIQLFTNSSHTQMYVTNTAGCLSGGVWEPYAPLKANWLLNPAQAGGIATVYVKYRDALNSESSCVSDSIVWLNFKKLCTDSTSTANQGLVYDDGGPTGNYAHNSDCTFSIQTTTPLAILIRSVSLAEGDYLKIVGENTISTLTGTSTPGVTQVDHQEPGGERTYTDVADFRNFTIFSNSGSAQFTFWTNSSGTSSGFEASWASLASPALPLGAGAEGSVLISGGAEATSQREVTVNLTYGSLAEVYITNTPGCAGGGVWEDVEPTKNWVLQSGDGLKTIYVKFRDSYLHESVCESDSIFLDQITPLAPLIKWIGVASVSDESPTLHFTGTDVGAGIQRFEARLMNAANNSVVKNWTPVVTGNKLTGIQVQSDTDYYFELRAFDLAGQVSTITRSDLWRVIPSITIKTPSKLVLNENSGVVSFEIKSSVTAGATISVPFSVEGDVTPEDYSLPSSVAVIPSGLDSVTVTFPLINDTLAEPEERLRIRLRPSANRSYRLDGYTDVEFLILANDGSFAAPVPSAIAVGASHACAIVNGGVQCWGDNNSGGAGRPLIDHVPNPTFVLPAGSGATSISAGEASSCAVVNGGVQCWGNNIIGQLGNGTTISRSTPVTAIAALSGATQVSTRNYFTCAVVNGGVQCWGNNTWGNLGNGINTSSSNPVTTIAAASGVTKVATGTNHACALISGGVRCWGFGLGGQIGNGTTLMSNRNPVTAIPAFSNVTDIATGGAHSCAIVNGGVKCWGSNDVGQLGTGTKLASTTPIDVFPPGSGVTAIEASDSKTCALVSGSLYCWGDNTNNLLGDGTMLSKVTPTEILPSTREIYSVSIGRNQTCASVTGGILCWGRNTKAQRGNNTLLERLNSYTVLPAQSGVTDIEAGVSHNCLIAQGSFQCWGVNYQGQLGNGTLSAKGIPVPILPVNTLNPTQASLSEGNTCLINNGGLKCWGANSDGQLGDGTLTRRTAPITIFPEGSGVTSVDISGTTSWVYGCAVVSGGVQCWGSNVAGKLGIGPPTSRKYVNPVSVIPAGSGATAVSLGNWDSHACVIIAGGLKCWGSNSYGQIGDGTTVDRYTPVTIFPEGSGVTAVSLGLYRTCAIIKDVVKCWGQNTYGAIGDGSTIDRHVPTNLSPLQSSVQSIATYATHSCLRTTAGGLKCWGHNGQGQLGDGTKIDRSSVTEILPAGSQVSDVSVGTSHTCAVINGGVNCWGSSVEGSLGDPEQINGPQWVFRLAP